MSYDFEPRKGLDGDSVSAAFARGHLCYLKDTHSEINMARKPYVKNNRMHSEYELTSFYL